MTNQTKKGEKMNAAKAKRVRVSIAKKSGVIGSLQKRAIKNLSLNDERKNPFGNSSPESLTSRINDS